ncbi:hypothetical protein ACWELV_08865 [Streptomyces mirabilis]|jgi:hypothetical protein
MTETEELRAAVELPAAKVYALDIVVDGDRATGRGHAPHLRRDAAAGRFWVLQVSANTWRWTRTTDDPPRPLRRTFDDPSAIERTRCGEWLKP